jgi:DNA-binding FadR family transcriptional regulator
MDLEAEVVVPQPDFDEEDNAALAAAHHAIFAAVAARDPIGARAAMASHVMDLQRRLERLEAARHPG